MRNVDKLKAELELLEMLQATNVQQHDFFLAHWQNKEVKIISPRLRNLISRLYPTIKWIKEDTISMEDWKEIEGEIMALRPTKAP